MRVRDAPRRNPHQFHRLQDDTGIYSLERSGAPDSTFVYCTSNENKDKCKHDNSFMCGTVWQDYFESTRVDSAQPTSCLNATDRSTVVFDYPFQLAPYYQWYAANPQCCLKVAKNLLTHRRHHQQAPRMLLSSHPQPRGPHLVMSCYTTGGIRLPFIHQ